MDLSTARSLYFSSSSVFTRWTSGVIVSYARSWAFRVLSDGLKSDTRLTIIDGDGEHEFGPTPSKDSPTIVLKVHNDSMWARILLSHDLGLGEAYMQGDFEVSSLKGLLNLWLDNRKSLQGLQNAFSSTMASYSAVAINALGRQTLKMSRIHVEVSYDVSNEFYQCFLSEDMMYSCALWGEEEGGVRGDLTHGPKPGDLEAAQLRKIRHLLRKARVRPGDHILELGSGWGAVAIEAARMGCYIETVTLSVEQKTLADQRIAEAGLSDRAKVHLCDYRNLPAAFEKSFDALVSSEMIEAVGVRQIDTWIKIVDWALKADRATAVITSTSCPEFRYSTFQQDDFARHYHWPNCHIHSATSLAMAFQAAAPGKFVLASLEDHGIHYARTLREWGRRLEKNFKGDVVAGLQKKYPHLRSERNLRAFKAKFEYLFVYAEVGFARAYTSCNCWTFARPENAVELCS
ncbi:cfs1-like protein [Steccherinum ochraceum]|uniref:Cfs1-like protein n=1 Tax=Steccherinum ochraceum TaxID=92696 RepID=A0A4R0RG30_9APHY|nr:cfs1-like protein [Steccherinum ochraceum]